MTWTEFRKLNETYKFSPESAELRIWTTLRKITQTRIR